MTVERVKHSGAYICSTIKKGYRVHQTYYGYTRKEAMAMFRGYLKTL